MHSMYRLFLHHRITHASGDISRIDSDQLHTSTPGVAQVRNLFPQPMRTFQTAGRIFCPSRARSYLLSSVED